LSGWRAAVAGMALRAFSPSETCVHEQMSMAPEAIDRARERESSPQLAIRRLPHDTRQMAHRPQESSP
jgi:hypothetical protein